MKIGYERKDALAGARYAVSAHLCEEIGAEELRKRFPKVETFLTRDSAEPQKARVLEMLRTAGYTVETWAGERDELAACTGETAVLTFGGAEAMRRDADQIDAACGDAEMPHIWWLSSPGEAFCLPRAGCAGADLVMCDPTVFANEGWAAAIVYAARLGMMVDKELFHLVYSSFDPVTLLARGCRLVQDLVRGDAGNIRSYLSFGEMMARVVDDMTHEELPHDEALAIGMMYEIYLGTKLGVCNPRKVSDLEGALTYHGLPRAIVASGEELAASFEKVFAGRDSVTFAVPVAIGKGKIVTKDTTDIVNLLTKAAF